MFEFLKSIDQSLLLKINTLHTPMLDVIMWQLSYNWTTTIFVIIFALFFYLKNKLKNFAAMILGIALVIACCDLTTNAIKHSVKRYRPTYHTELKTKLHLVNNYSGGKYGFVSGHSGNNFGIITFIFLTATWINKRKKIFFFIYPFLVVYSRMYLGVHYPSDIIVGAGIGVLYGILIHKLITRYFYKKYEEN